MSEAEERTVDLHPATVPESELLAACEARRQRRSGPGGQHRNKVETAVVLTHVPTGVQGSASERRSQEENRQQALFRLRVNLALAVRAPVAAGASPSPLWISRCRGGRIAVSSSHLDFPAVLAEALDRIGTCDADVKRAAAELSCSPSQLIRLLQQEPRALQQVNDRRRELGQHPLK